MLIRFIIKRQENFSTKSYLTPFWDDANRLTQLQNTTVSGHVVNNTGYIRDAMGNILTATEASGTSQTPGATTYTYDADYRLLSAGYPTSSLNESFSYDAVGNRKTYTKGGTTYYYNRIPGSNRLKNITTGSTSGTVYESYVYDNNGNLTSISGNRTMALSWTANNKVSQIQVGSITPYTYQYDPKGYRIQKTVGTVNKNYYLEKGKLEAIYDGSGDLQAKYLRGSVIDEVVNGYQFDSNNNFTNYSFHHDNLESVLGQSSHDGNVLASQGYTSFGTIINASGSSSNNILKFTGREQDTETGLIYYRARYYDPLLGMMLSEDPMWFGAGVNFYIYCGNNPVNSNDPSGKVNIFVGGFGDTSLSGGIVYNYSRFSAPSNGQQTAYFSWDQGSDIQDFINSQSADEPINIIGHSYGGDTAAEVTADSSRAINMLVTVDPVSMSQPNFTSVANNSALWVNVNAQPSNSMQQSNVIAGVGGAWDSDTEESADISINAAANHADFSTMMNSAQVPYQTPAMMLNNPSIAGLPSATAPTISPSSSISSSVTASEDEADSEAAGR